MGRHANLHPDQGLVVEEVLSGEVIRFRKNRIVYWLLDKGCTDLNQLRILFHADEYRDEWRQFYQLIGYSVEGYCDLSVVDRKERLRVRSKAAAKYSQYKAHNTTEGNTNARTPDSK